MSVFNNGDGDLTATNLVAAVLELGYRLTKAEDYYNASSPQFPLTTTSFSLTTTNGSATITSALPVSDSRVGGVVGFQARNIFAGTTFGDFNPGTGGDLFSTNLPAAFFELCQLVDDAEKAVASNVVQTQPKMITHAIDLNSRLASITCALPIKTGLKGADGSVTIDAVDVLP